MAVTAAANTKVLSQLVERSAESRRRLEAPEAQHPVVALFDGAVVLLGEVIQVLVRPMQSLSTQDPAHCHAVGGMPMNVPLSAGPEGDAKSGEGLIKETMLRQTLRPFVVATATVADRG